MKWFALILTGLALGFTVAYLNACDPATCQVRASVDRYRDPATGIYTVRVRCRDAVLASRACYDGGVVVVGHTDARVYCDGVTLATMPRDVTEVQP